MNKTKNNQVPLLFFSHSSQDIELVKFFVKAARLGFGLNREDIRFSSEDAYGFEPGHSLGNQAQREGTKASVFIAVLTPNSLGSEWVKTELGARWGVKKPIYFIIANGASFDKIPPAYKDIVAKSCTESGLESLFRKIGEELGKPYDFESGREFIRAAEAYSNAIAEAIRDKPGDAVKGHNATAEAEFVSPVSGTEHKSPVEYEVKCTKLPAHGNSLWLCVEVDKKVWPKHQLTFNQANDSLKSSIKEDGTSGYFFLTIVEVNPDGQNRIEKWFADGKAHNDYPGIDDLVGDSVAHTQVIRKSL